MSTLTIAIAVLATILALPVPLAYVLKLRLYLAFMRRRALIVASLRLFHKKMRRGIKPNPTEWNLIRIWIDRGYLQVRAHECMKVARDPRTVKFYVEFRFDPATYLIRLYAQRHISLLNLWISFAVSKKLFI